MADRFQSGRMEAFSDGVFAIAATLLVLEISVPESGFADLWGAIGSEWPSYLACTTSFFTIGGLWSVHHGLFRRISYADARLMRLNLVLLWVVAFLPFPTMLIAEALRREGDEAERAAVLFYGGTLLVISLLVTTMCAYVARRRSVLPEGVLIAELRELNSRTRPTATFYGGILLLAVLAPRVAAWGFLAVALAAVLLAPWVRGARVPAGPR